GMESNMERDPEDIKELVLYEVHLAHHLGLHAAIILGKLLYWLKTWDKNKHDGRSWIRKSAKEWADDTGLSARQARIACNVLAGEVDEQGKLKFPNELYIVTRTAKYNDPNKGAPSTYWYAINDEVLEDLRGRSCALQGRGCYL
ncbi:hypothetical protein LCGC14_2911620, partial [marine sediment metagenome]